MTVLRPKLVWRIGLPPLLVGFVAGVVSTGGDDAVVFWKGALSVVMLAGLLLAAFRSRIELHAGMLYRRGPFGWTEPIAARDIEEVEFHWEINGLPHREISLTTYSKRGWMLSLRWWAGWWRLIGWLGEHCTRVEHGQVVWAVRTDPVTRDRLEPYARPRRPVS
jgi:hypothetical protein